VEKMSSQELYAAKENFLLTVDYMGISNTMLRNMGEPKLERK